MQPSILIFYFLAHIADVGTTYVALKEFGMDEVNPLPAYLMQLWGRDVVLLLKLLLVSVIAWWLWRWQREFVYRYALLFGGLLTWWVGVLNLSGILGF
jgi:uncharacterized membrane protein